MIDLLIELELEERRRKEQRLQSYKSQIEYYQQNPLDYFVERLGYRYETLVWSSNPGYDKHRWDGTKDPFVKILESINNNRWVGVESATSTGKTKFGAGLVLWFLECFENSLVVTTAPKEDQLKLHIWRELGRMFPKFGRGYLNNLKLKMRNDSDDWLAVGFVAGVAADEESARKAQGFHAEHMLIIFEETPGIPEPVITAFENTATAPHNIIVAFGNPDHELDTLHKFCNQSKVDAIRISGYDHPNVVLGDDSFVPGAVTSNSLNRMLERYGDPNHPLYLSRARGISPTESFDSLIKIKWCNDCIEKWKSISDHNNNVDFNKVKGPYALGVDVANSESGDKAAQAFGKGNVLAWVIDFNCPDSNQLGHQIYHFMMDNNIKPYNVGIDGVGVGAGTINTLKEHGIANKSINIQGAAEPTKNRGEEKFNNLRSQMWWKMREDIRLGNIMLPDDKELIADLTTPKWFVRNGKIVIESKEEIKKRLGRSPNKGDAAVYWNWVRDNADYDIQIHTNKSRLSTKLSEGF